MQPNRFQGKVCTTARRRNHISEISLAVLVFTATFGASIASAQNPLPKGWSGTQVGSPTPSGSTSEKKGIYTISGGGSDIWATSDQFMFANTLFVGDGTIVARIDSVRAADPDTKPGIMFGESLSASSANALAMIDGAGNYQYQWRPAF